MTDVPDPQALANMVEGWCTDQRYVDHHMTVCGRCDRCLAAAYIRKAEGERARTEALIAWLTTLANDRESWNEYTGRTEDDDLDEARAALAAHRQGVGE